MDDRTKRRGALPFGVGRHGSCFASKQLDHEARTSRYPTRIGSNTRVTAFKSIEDKELGQSSKSDGSPSSSKTLSQKSAQPVPKLGSSSTAKPRKMSRVFGSSGMSGQSSSTRNLSLGLGQLAHGGSVFQRGGGSTSSRLGLAEISNLTSKEGSSCDFNFLQETPSSSLSRSIFHSNSGIVSREPGDTSRRYPSRQGSESELLTVNRRLSDLIHEDEQEHVWTGIDDDCTTDIGTASTSSLSPGFMNDLPERPIIFNDPETTSDDSFVTVSSMAGDLFDVNSVSSSDYLLRSGSLINQRSQEPGNLRRGMTGYTDNTSVSLGEEINISRSSMSKRRTPIVRTASQGASRGSSHESFTTRSGSGLTERYVGRSSAVSTSRNLGKFGCSSASDVLPLNVSPFNAQHSEQSGNRRLDPSRRTTDGRDSARGQHMAKVPLTNNTGGPVSQRTIRSGGAIGPHCQMSSTPRASRRTVRATQPGAFSSQEIHEGDNIVDLGLSSERNSANVHVSDQNRMLGNRHRALSPSLTRGRSPIGALQRRNDLPNGEACTLGERVANRLGATTRRSTSTSAASARFFGLAGSPSRLNSICSDSGSSSYNLLTEEEVGNITPIISVPAPLRAPPLPPVATSSQPQANSSLSLSLPFSGPMPPHALLPLASSGSASQTASVSSNSLHLFDGATFGRSATGSDVPSERPLVVHSESSGRRAFRSLSFERRSPSQYAMEGLAEVLLALERIEQDDDLTYEQVLMLEANLLFGGISMHDQHSDMRLDIDNMSYEELLALEERIGSVSTGLTEEAISKSMKKILFVSDVAIADSNSLESEVKCSVCQEEYEGGDEIGRLNCEHSYHADCIKKWLLQKNQCPICKAPASP